MLCKRKSTKLKAALTDKSLDFRPKIMIVIWYHNENCAQPWKSLTVSDKIKLYGNSYYNICIFILKLLVMMVELKCSLKQKL